MPDEPQYRTVHEAVRDGIVRAVAVVGLTGVALIHLLDAPGKFSETPYLGWMYLALIAGCVLVAVTLIGSNDRRSWAAAALLPAGAIVGYVLTRTTGLPQATGDIGNWTEPLGLASLFVEGSLVALGGAVLAGSRTTATATVQRARRVPHGARTAA
jgi:hypothetical protein